MKEIIKWQTVDGHGHILVAVQVEIGDLHARGLEDNDLLPIEQWSRETGCGKRTSFDTWKFKDEAELTMFRLKWIFE